MDYCSHYVKLGVMRYQSGKYAQSSPPMGTMLGYLQEGDFSMLFDAVNRRVKEQESELNQIERVSDGQGCHNPFPKAKKAS